MADPVTVQVPLELLKQIRLALRECAEDLDAELTARYGDSAEQYPSEARRYKRDRAPVVDAIYCCDQLDALEVHGLK